MKIVVIYIFLMGLLFAVLLGILQIGKGLKAPVNVSGEWQISNISDKGLNNICSSFKLTKENSEASIEQSGVYVTLIIGDPVTTKFSGKIDNLNLLLTEDNNHSKCIPVLYAGIIQGSRDELKGKINYPGCGDCPDVIFSAVRYH